MKDQLNECQQKQERLDMLIQEAEVASANKDYKKVTDLWHRILPLRKGLEVTLNELEAEYQEKQQKLAQLIQEKDKASKEQDYEKAAQLRIEELLQTQLIQEKDEASKEQDYEKAAQLRIEELLQLDTELPQLKEQIEQRQSKLAESMKHIEQLEIDFEIGRRNFVRAVMLAERLQHPLEQVRYLQETALKQYACEYRNAQGLEKLIQWYRLSKSEAKKLIYEGLSEWKGYDGKQYDINVMDHIKLEEFVDNFVASKL
jgi:hypothetical protein